MGINDRTADATCSDIIRSAVFDPSRHRLTISRRRRRERGRRRERDDPDRGHADSLLVLYRLPPPGRRTTRAPTSSIVAVQSDGIRMTAMSRTRIVRMNAPHCHVHPNVGNPQEPGLAAIVRQVRISPSVCRRSRRACFR